MYILSRPWIYNSMSHEAHASDPLNLFSELQSKVAIFAILSSRYILLSLLSLSVRPRYSEHPQAGTAAPSFAFI